MKKMTDNWSLKGKSFTVLEQCGLEEIETDEDIAYTKNDIDTLRKKLIEDFSPLNILGDRGPFFTREQAIRFINKRFGVEE